MARPGPVRWSIAEHNRVADHVLELPSAERALHVNLVHSVATWRGNPPRSMTKPSVLNCSISVAENGPGILPDEVADGGVYFVALLVNYPVRAARDAFDGQLRDEFVQPVQVLGEQSGVFLAPDHQRRNFDHQRAGVHGGITASTTRGLARGRRANLVGAIVI